MLISVVIPFHRSLDELQRAISSVQLQSNSRNQFQIEIIIGNDSKFENDYIYSKLNNIGGWPISVVRNKFDNGAGNARNAALSKAKGTYVAFLDSDDVWLTDKLESQICSASSDSNFITTAFSYENSTIVISPPKKITKSKDLFFSRPIGTSTVLLKRSLMGEKKFSNLRFCQDLILWFELSKLNNFKYESIPKVKTIYSLNGRTSKSNYFERAYYMWKTCKLCDLGAFNSFLAIIFYCIKGFYNKVLSRFFYKYLYLKR